MTFFIHFSGTVQIYQQESSLYTCIDLKYTCIYHTCFTDINIVDLGIVTGNYITEELPVCIKNSHKHLDKQKSVYNMGMHGKIVYMKRTYRSCLEETGPPVETSIRHGFHKASGVEIVRKLKTSTLDTYLSFIATIILSACETLQVSQADTIQVQWQ